MGRGGRVYPSPCKDTIHSIVFGNPWCPPEVCNPGKVKVASEKTQISRVTANEQEIRRLELITFGSITHLPCVSSQPQVPHP